MMMECNIGILLASHGEYCHGAKNSLEMIIGDCPDLLCVSVTPSMNNEDVQVQMREAYELLKKECSEVLIFTDLLCGSPNHAAVRLMMSREDITVVTGYNLAILVELVNRRNTSDLKVQELLNGIEDTLASRTDCNNLDQQLFYRTGINYKRSDSDG